MFPVIWLLVELGPDIKVTCRRAALRRCAGGKKQAHELVSQKHIRHPAASHSCSVVFEAINL